MNNSPIGILDSGIGGLTIWREIVKKLPHESTIYIADSLNCPYGIRSEEEIRRLSTRLVSFLLANQVKLIVVACNTITVSALDYLRAEYPQTPIIGTVPVVKTAAEKTKNGRIGILSTSRTAQSSYQKALIEKFAKGVSVLNLGTDRLVPFIERGEIASPEFQKILQKELEPFQETEIDVLALGCSHYPFVKTQIQAILGPNIAVLDSAEAIARQVERVLRQRNEISNIKKAIHSFFTTTSSEEARQVLTKVLLHIPSSPSHVSLV